MVNAMMCLEKNVCCYRSAIRNLGVMQRYAFIAVVALLGHVMTLGFSLAGPAEQEFWQVRIISDRGVLTLTDGRQVCLNNVWFGGERRSKRQKAELKEVLGALTRGQAVRIDQDNQPAFDRYGCLMANVETDGGVSLQQALLKRGLAMVIPMSTSPEKIDDWLALEAEARRSGIGLWQDQRFKPKKATAMTEHVGKVSLVEGRVVRMSNNDRYMYLNFGQDWRTDFTVRVRNKLLKQSGVEPGYFDGKRLRVRGFVQESRGPLIDISHLKQIEVMP